MPHETPVVAHPLQDNLPRMSPFVDPHRRHDPLLDEWVLVSAGRSARPWQGAIEPAATEDVPAHDPGCPLCPGNVRAGGARNPAYAGTFAFDNDFAALRSDGWSGGVPAPFEDGLLRAEPEWGTCRVICFSPRHDRSLGALEAAERRAVVDTWADQTADLGRDHRWVQVFENRGVAMGASNPHPHGQVWAGSALPTTATRELDSQRRHLATTGRRLLLDVVDQESGGARVVLESDRWLVVVPFWARWPFETLLVAKAPVERLPDLDDEARDDLAAVLGGLLGRYDGLFGRPFPYSMGWHQAPSLPEDDGTAWQLHAHAYPPLLRADTRKFMVGYELLAEPQRDLRPEDAAAALRGVASAR